MDKFLGRAVKRGEMIPAEDMARISPQATRSLVEGRYISMEGMSPSSSTGMETHLRARVDNQDDRLKRVEAENVDLRARIETLEKLTQLDSAGEPPMRHPRPGKRPKE